MNIFHDWQSPLDAPTVGDDLIVKHLITISANQTPWSGIPVAVQPKSVTGTLTAHAKAIAALLKQTDDNAKSVLNCCIRPEIELIDVDAFRIQVKNLLGVRPRIAFGH